MTRYFSERRFASVLHLVCAMMVIGTLGTATTDAQVLQDIITLSEAQQAAQNSPLYSCWNKSNCELCPGSRPTQCIDSNSSSGKSGSFSCGSRCGTGSGGASPSQLLAVQSTVGFGDNGPSALAAATYTDAAVVFNFGVNMMHWGDDIRTMGSGPGSGAGCGTVLRRIHRPRHIALASSLGPGVFTNFDIRLVAESSSPDMTYLDFLVRDPFAAIPYSMYDASDVYDDQGNRLYIIGTKLTDLAGKARMLKIGAFTSNSQISDFSVAPADPENDVTSSNYYFAFNGWDTAELECYDGGKMTFDILRIPDHETWNVVLGYDPLDENNVYPGYTEARYGGGFFNEKLIGRLTSVSGAAGTYTVTYKQPTVTEVFNSFDYLHQIDTVTGPDGTVMTFQYNGGDPKITSVTSSDGQTATYQYTAGGFLSSVAYADSTTASFTHSGDASTGLAEIAFDDHRAPEGHQKKKAYVTGIVAGMSGNDILYYNGAVNLVRVIANEADEVVYANFGLSDVGEGQTILVYEGGGKLRAFRETFNLSQQNGYRRRFINEVDDGWQIDITGGGFNYTGTEQDAYAFKTYSATNMLSSTVGYIQTPTSVQLYNFDDDGVFGIVGYLDGSFESTYRDEKKRPLRFRDRQGRVTKYEYNTDGMMTKKMVGILEDPSNGNGIDPYSGGAAYDPNPTNDIQTADYAVYQWQYNTDNRITKYIDPLGNETDYAYDTNGRLTTVTKPATNIGGTRPTIGYTYDTSGLVKTVTDPVGDVIEYFYDSQDRLISTLYDDGTTDRIFYVASGNGEGQVEKLVNRMGVVTTYAYDSSHRLTSRTVASGTMDGAGNETATPDLALAETWTYLTGTKLPLQHRRGGLLTTHVYDHQLRREETTQEISANQSLTSKYAYVDGKLYSTEDPHGRKTFYAYDDDGRLIRTVIGTVPEFTVPGTDPDPYVNLLALNRDTTANADYIISDTVYSSAGDIERQHDGRNIETHFEYDSRGRQTARIAAAGTTIEARDETDYDLDSHVLAVRSPRYFDATDTGGYQKASETWTYTPAGLAATHNEAPGTTEAATESYVYDLAGRRTQHTDFAGKIWKTHHEDCCGQVTASENPLGHGSITRTSAIGLTVHQATVADYTDHVTALDNPVDAKTYREVTTRYDGRGRPIARTTWLVARGVVDATDPPIAGLDGVSAADGLTEQYLYDDNLADNSGLDSSGGVTPLIGSNAISLSTALTQLADTEAGGGAGITFDADAPGTARVTINAEGEVRFSISSGGGNVMSGILDPANNSLLTWNCTGKPATQTITGYGTVLVSKTINALGKVRKTLTDAAGRTIENHDALGKVTTYTYDAAGNQTSVRDPNSVGQDCTYDQLGRDLTCTDTAGDATSSAYDRAGNKITATDAKNNTTTYAFNARGRQTSQTDRLSGVTSFAYTATGQLASLTDAENQVTSYTYDDSGNKLTETYPDHTGGTPGQSTYGIVTFTHDPADRTQRKQDQTGDTVTYNYDLAGRLTSRDYRTAANSPSGTIADSDTFTYDAAGRMLTAASGRYSNTVTYTYDDAGRKSTEALTIAGQTYTTTTTYNAAGQVTGYSYPDGTAVARSYTDRGQLATIAVDGTTIDTRSYDDGGRMTSSVYNNGVTQSRVYNNDNTLASITHTGAAIGNYSYGWDENKNKTSETITGTMSGYGFSVGSSGYDNEDRLVNWQRDDTGLDQSWNLSLVGDWNSITENLSTQSRTHGAAHELLTAASQSITHDVKGNMTTIPAVLRSGSNPLALTWDFDNRLIGADIDNDSTDDVTYGYDALGRRVKRDDGTTATIFVQNGQQTIADYTSGTAATSPIYTYVYAAYIDEPVYRGGSGGTRYYHRNQQYSITALTNGSGTIQERYAYMAYGEPTITDATGTVRTSTAEGNRYTYTGREWDEESELYHYRARMYDPLSGRFCSRDPIGYVDGWNMFASNLGLDRTDPTGWCAIEKKCNIKSFDLAEKECGFHNHPVTDVRVWGFSFTIDIEFLEPCECCKYEQYLLEKSYVIEQKIGNIWIKIEDLPEVLDDYSGPGREDCVGEACPGGKNPESDLPINRYSEDGCKFTFTDTPNIHLPSLVDILKPRGIIPGRFRTTIKWRFLLNVVDTCNNRTIRSDRLDRQCGPKEWTFR